MSGDNIWGRRLPAAKPYHHGNLRSALIEAGLSLVRSTGPAHVTTRACAQAVGVASSAVYRHFADHRALATAVAAEGFRALGMRIEAARAAVGAEAQLRAIGESYLAFAIDEPHLFRLMFRGEMINVADPDLRAASEPLIEDAASVSGAGGEPDRDRAILAWAIVHGLATLMLDSQLDELIPSAPGERRRTLERIVGMTTPLFQSRRASATE